MSKQDNHGVSDQQQPEVDLAARTFELLAANGQGTLATQSIKHDGFPFASVMPYALSNDRTPIFLISSMANHTRNVKADPKACLLVAADDAGDRLAGSRVSVIGRVIPVDEAKLANVRQSYLAKHPGSQQWVDFGDFAFYELQIEDIYIVAGFGSMGWVETDKYLAAGSGS